jgi:CHAT domain-containing protein
MARNGIRSLTNHWNVELEATAPAFARRGIANAERELPSFLLEGPLEPYRVAIATRVPQAAVRGAVGPLKFAVEVEAGLPVVAVARHASGALTFHLPTTAASRAASASRRAPATPIAVFEIYDAGADTGGVPSAEGRRAIISKVIRVVLMKVARPLVDVAAPFLIEALAKRWEKRAWGNRLTGWKAVTEAGMAAGVLEPSIPDYPVSQPILLLLHGTFSHTVAAFQDLYKGGVLGELIAQYGGRVFGFDHYSVSVSPDTNARDLVSALGHEMAFDVVTHSRGGLVLRSVVEKRDGAATFQLGRAVLTCSPNQGTPLATPGRWEQTLGWFANLLELLPENPFVTAGQFVAECLSWLAQHISGDLPGIESMDVDGETVRDLEVSKLPVGDWYALASDFQPDQGWVARLADVAVDGFFQGPNDLVVPTIGSWQLGETTAAFVPPTRIGCFGPIGNIHATGEPIHHTNIFSDPATQTFLRRALAGQDLNIPPLPAPTVAARLRQATLEAFAAARQVPAAEVAQMGEAEKAAGATPRETVKIVEHGWDGEDPLHLIVLPPDAKDRSRQEAQLLAIFGSARVLAPFRLADETANADARWKGIFEFQKKINAVADGSLGSLELHDLHEGGSNLFNVLLQADVRRLYDQARYLHRNRKLNMVFTSMIPWVADLPWEFAYDPGSQAFLATGDVRFVRNVLTAVPADKIEPVQRALKILVVSAQPTGTIPLSAEEEVSKIRRAFRPLIDAGGVWIDVLPRATPAKFHSKVRSNSYDIVHFIGHGEFNEADGTGYLLFSDDKNQPMPLSTSVLKDILRGRGVRLMFLNACDTGRGSRADYNKGVAPGLVADGVPAVLANQYAVLDGAATVFSLHFYSCLTQGLSLGDAVRESRIALKYSGGDLMSWAVPVLFARNPDARLCERVSTADMDASMLTGISSSRRAETRAMATSPQSESSTWEIAIWDVTDSFTELDRTIETLNEVQKTFEFFPINLNVPYGTWKVSRDLFDGIAYLAAERVADRLRNVVNGVDADYVFCVTDRPLADESTKNLYWWADDGSNFRFNIMSTWGFHPPIRESSFPCALTNVVVDALARFVSKVEVDTAIKGSVFYYNEERAREYLVGRLSIPETDRQKLAGALSREALRSLELMLAAFHPNEQPLPFVGPQPRRTRRRAAPKRTRRRRPKK